MAAPPVRVPSVYFSRPLSHDVKADNKMQLNNYVQGAGFTIEYSETTSGPQQSLTWNSTVFVNGIAHGTGRGTTKAAAQESAAGAALTYIQQRSN
ncbi:hypothetical protein PQX77_003784 [Marasmius sp. AFHP31]|nr:hypothetical protein PQX77_003784 [Marasmius sp. AFHP31]